MYPDQKVKNWLTNPYPLWDPDVTESLISGFALQNSFYNYSIEKSLAGIYDPKHLISLSDEESLPNLELPSRLLKAFYNEHGLEPIFFDSTQSEQAIEKLICALNMIKLLEPAYLDILLLVKTIQIIEAECAETDISYSHPNIPFSIFISLCQDDSPISNLRVAESMIHEAMHLKLTLIENIIPLVIPGSRDVYYSPWREEDRPVRGVLHGLFVFRALLDFFLELKIPLKSSSEFAYIESRINHISKEINLIVDFPNCVALTKEGRLLSKSLLNNNLR